MASPNETGQPNHPPNEKPLPRSQLPRDLQKIVDNEESLFDQIYDGTANESTSSNVRYAAYATRLRTILLSAHRYVAYTSDIGESFRPVAHPWLIRGAYGVSWAYLVGDVGYEGYKAYLRNQRVRFPGEPGVVSGAVSDAREQGGKGVGVPMDLEEVKGRKVPLEEDWRSVMAERAVFQSIASMGLPAFTIHSIVRYSGRALKDVKNTRVRAYGPIGLGLAAVPFLPVIFDKPVEVATEWVFHNAFKTFGGPDAVANNSGSGTGRLQGMIEEKRKGAGKEKEL